MDLAEQNCRIINFLDARVGISYGTGRLLKVDFGGLLGIGFAASRLRGDGCVGDQLQRRSFSRSKLCTIQGRHLQTYRWMSLA